MADQADMASDTEEFFDSLALRNAKAMAEELYSLIDAYHKTCLYCDEPIPAGRYCDADCRDDHQQELRAKSARGRRG